jgi:hypothetical protein
MASPKLSPGVFPDLLLQVANDRSGSGAAVAAWLDHDLFTLLSRLAIEVR